MIGFHVYLEDGCQKFLKKLIDCNVTAIKLHIPPDTSADDIKDVCSYAMAEGVSVYLSVCQLLEGIHFNPISLDSRYVEILNSVRGFDNIIGVSLVEHSHSLIRRGRGVQKYTREWVKEYQNKLSEIIKSYGRPVVLNCRESDIISENWSGVDFDIYDFDGPVKSSQYEKPFWSSGLMKLHGYIVDSERMGVLKIAKESKADIAFVYSRKSRRFSWDHILEGRRFNEEDIKSYEAE